MKRAIATIAVAVVVLCHEAATFVLAPAFRGVVQGTLGTRSTVTGKSKLCMMAVKEDFDVNGLTADAEERMMKSVESVRANLQTLRTGRASPALLDRVMVECYGMETPLNQVASVKTTGASQLLVEAYDKSILEDIASAIMQSSVGLTPTNDGNVIRLNIPEVTEDRKKGLCKEAKAMGEDGKVAIRNIRREVVDKFKKAEKSKDLGTDQSKDAVNSVQKLTDKHVKVTDDVVSAKEKEIMTV